MDDAKTLARRFGCCEARLELSLERGRHAGKQRKGASGGKRAQAGAPTRGKEAEPYEVKFSIKSSDCWPIAPSRPGARRGASDVLKMRPDKYTYRHLHL